MDPTPHPNDRDEEPGLRPARMPKNMRQLVGHTIGSGAMVTPDGALPTVTIDMQHIALRPPSGPIKHFNVAITADNALYLAEQIITAAVRSKIDVEAGMKE